MANYLNQDGYGYGYDDFDEYSEDESPMNALWYSIDGYKFYKSSVSRLMSTVANRRRMLDSLRVALRGTYFKWLPNELFEMILMYELDLENHANDAYWFHMYFAEHNTMNNPVRFLRPTKAQRAALTDDGYQGGLVFRNDGVNSMWSRGVLPNNQCGEAMRDLREMLDVFTKYSKNKLPGIRKMYEMLVKHGVWICEHSYIPCWNKFMHVMYEKVQQHYEKIKEYVETETPDLYSSFRSIGSTRKAYTLIKKLKYFVEEYIPYVILTRSDVWDEAAYERVNPDFHKELIYVIHGFTQKHPNDIDLHKAYEFELELNAPKYFKNVYSKYTRLRTGKRLIPVGERPMFYWVGDKYVQRFV